MVATLMPRQRHGADKLRVRDAASAVDRRWVLQHPDASLHDERAHHVVDLSDHEGDNDGVRLRDESSAHHYRLSLDRRAGRWWLMHHPAGGTVPAR